MAFDTKSMQKILPVYCTAGQHRADSTAKASATVLNAVGATHGHRVWNVKVFSLSCMNIWPDAVQSTVVTEAWRWLTNTWTIAPCPNFGADASQQTRGLITAHLLAKFTV